MSLLDTHQHLWDLARFPYSWCRDLPQLNRSFRPADYHAAAAGLDITGTVLVEGDVDDPHGWGEARLFQQLADADPLIRGIVASCRPEHPDFEGQLDRLCSLPKVRGVRRVLHVVPDDVSQDARFVRHLRLLPARGLTFDLCVLARQLPLALRLVERLPEVTFILDHCGVPDIRGGEFGDWRRQVDQLAQHPHVHCKVSGLVAYADPRTLTPQVLRPLFDHVVATFGYNRLVWGGDWPVCTLATSLRSWVEMTHQLTATATPEQRDRFYQANAVRLYRL